MIGGQVTEPHAEEDQVLLVESKFEREGDLDIGNFLLSSVGISSKTYSKLTFGHKC